FMALWDIFAHQNNDKMRPPNGR
ncbi:MAG: hypothetical protein JWQ01_718, partial [Massilia sp.]|nr:hypothetical protein [Massilia sp.]